MTKTTQLCSISLGCLGFDSLRVRHLKVSPCSSSIQIPVFTKIPLIAAMTSFYLVMIKQTFRDSSWLQHHLRSLRLVCCLVTVYYHHSCRLCFCLQLG